MDDPHQRRVLLGVQGAVAMDVAGVRSVAVLGSLQGLLTDIGLSSHCKCGLVEGRVVGEDLLEARYGVNRLHGV